MMNEKVDNNNDDASWMVSGEGHQHQGQDATARTNQEMTPMTLNSLLTRGQQDYFDLNNKLLSSLVFIPSWTSPSMLGLTGLPEEEEQLRHMTMTPGAAVLNLPTAILLDIALTAGQDYTYQHEQEEEEELHSGLADKNLYCRHHPSHGTPDDNCSSKQ
jgi:hypothetical protein